MQGTHQGTVTPAMCSGNHAPIHQGKPKVIAHHPHLATMAHVALT